MSTGANGQSLADEFVTFIQHQLPGLEDGSYELDISQHVDDAKGEPINEDTLAVSYKFAITGDRFRLSNPAAAIASTFPADNATGEFVTVLPHVVLNSPTFPWARYPTTAPPPLPPPGQDTTVDVPTWLAVLVLDDDDATAYGFALDPVTRTLGDLFPPQAYCTTSLGTNYSYFTGAINTSALEVDEIVADPVQTIDIPLALFADLAPTLDDLRLSAHVRRVSIENKALALGDEPPSDPLGTFAIVVGTRLPQDTKKSHAYLVSLEGLEGFLAATDQGGALADGSVDLTRDLRLAVLRHWTFNTKGESAAFVDQVEQLNGRTIGGTDAANTNLRIAKLGATGPIKTALDAGYVPLAHDLRTGEGTVSWYRGPLCPVDSAPAPISLPVSSPDQALVFDPTTGMLDTSLAAAWTVGRLLALQDKSYASALYAWKKGLAQSVVDAAEQTIISDVLGELLAMAPATDGAPPTGKQLLHHTMRLIGSGSR
jgi:hypothetical protein